MLSASVVVLYHVGCAEVRVCANHAEQKFSSIAKEVRTAKGTPPTAPTGRRLYHLSLNLNLLNWFPAASTSESRSSLSSSSSSSTSVPVETKG